VTHIKTLSDLVGLRSHGEMCTSCLCFHGLKCGLASFCFVNRSGMRYHRHSHTRVRNYQMTGGNLLEAALGAVTALRKPYETMLNVRSFGSPSPTPPVYSDLTSNISSLIFEQTGSLWLMFYWYVPCQCQLTH
jgi:hypothetical protein